MSLPSKLRRYRLILTGVVQGVGLRPFIYTQAKALSLCGFVCNDASGVLIEIEGDPMAMQTFVALLKTKAPPLALIETLDMTSITPLGCDDFIIKPSQSSSSTTLISADIALCEKCLKELYEPSNRRHHYPFINCTDCGPRYTTITTRPFDRPHTAMRSFKPCKECDAEYKDPDNRRFHAQTISCDSCGPQVRLLDPQGRVISDKNSALDQLAQMIIEGKIVALKGWGGFHILCDANNAKSVEQLRHKKRRPAKPFAVMFPSIEKIKEVALLTTQEEELLTSKEHPIVLVKPKNSLALSNLICCGVDKLGVFLPYAPLHHLLLDKLKRPIVATSANFSDEPIITDETKLLESLHSVVSAVLTHNLPIMHSCDDSVMMVADKHPMTLRSARGMAPYAFLLTFNSPKKILALGGNQKTTLALTQGSHIVVSPHIGDLDSIESMESFGTTLERFCKLYDFKPDLIVHDQHPEYETTQWALEQNIPTLAVQHHYAHALSCMAEYELNQEVLAFCFDGTGYGHNEDNNISGAHTIDAVKLLGSEILLADPQHYERILHLRPFKLLGASVAIKEPRRIALAMLFECFSLDELLDFDLPTLKSFSIEEIKTLHHMWENDINAPLTTSMGRFFDAVASFSDLIQTVSYEGQSGLLIESNIPKIDLHYHYPLTIKNKEIDYRPIIKELLNHEPEKRATIFMQTIINLILTICKQHPDLPVILSGGVFQNQCLVSNLIKAFKSSKITYYIPSKVPVNDGGIAVGQIYHAILKDQKRV